MQTATAEAIKPASGLKAVLRTAQKAPETAKGKTPVLSVSDDIRQLAQEVRDLKERMESAQTKFDVASAILVERVSVLRAELCKKQYTSSVRVPTLDDLSVTVVWSGNYIKIKPDFEPVIQGIVGEKYADYFKSKFIISATDKSDNELYQLFEWLGSDCDGDSEHRITIGQERFAKFFTVDEVIRPTERFCHEHVLMGEAMREQLEAAGIKQYKAAIKNR